MYRVIDGIEVIYEGEFEEGELEQYVKRGQEKYGKHLRGINCLLDGDYVNISYDVPTLPFTRLRRITGYLVGDMNRWNNAKRKEEGDRVKHGIDKE